MEKIKWSDNLSVGISVLDEQHKQLIGMINLLVEFSNDSLVLENITKTLRKITQYAVTHFEDEERIMIDQSYPDYIRHSAQHTSFIMKTASVHSINIMSDDDTSIMIVEYLREWLTDHILEEDMNYKQFYKNIESLDKGIALQCTS